jgi:phospholipid transport system substrate-binding protein
MRSLLVSLLLTPLALLAAPAAAAEAHPEIVKPLKVVVGAVRFAQDKAALKHFAALEQGKRLLGSDWEKGTEAQRKEFLEVFQVLFAKMAFPKVREDFKYLDAVTYGDPELSGEIAHVNSVVSIQHQLKKQEYKLRYELVKDAGAWKIVDVAVLGDSMLKGIKEDQVDPIMKEGGWPHLLDLMRQKAKELESVTLK